MKINRAIYPVLLSGLLLTIAFSCKKESPKAVPSITIATVTNITANTAISGGEVTSDGGAAVTTRGVCWSVNQNPTIVDSKTSDGAGIGSFTSSITGLKPGVTYYFKAYAINAVGTTYSSQIICLTLTLAPVLTTIDLSSVTSTTASSGGNITSDGGSVITARGVVWGTISEPTISLSTKTINGTGIGNFTSNITGLNPGATYYIRAYATNSVGTGYGNQVTATTTAILPSITTNMVSVITSTTTTCGGNITSDGGTPILACGVCWNTTTGPTTALITKTSDGIATGNFNSNLTGLTYSTTYYIRAYATNSVGTVYGNEVSFTTTPLFIGDSYQGGKVAYILQSGDPGYITSQTHGLIAALSDQATYTEQWYNGSYTTTGATATVLGSGSANTRAIILSQGNTVYGYAAQLCRGYNGGGYVDWYLPSKDELYKLYINKLIIGGFQDSNAYWSSSEASDVLAWVQAFAGSGLQTTHYKDITHSVRAVRSF